MGLPDDNALSSIRFSLGRFTTEIEIDLAIERVLDLARKLKS
jgi:cysteine desulfurase